MSYVLKKTTTSWKTPVGLKDNNLLRKKINANKTCPRQTEVLLDSFINRFYKKTCILLRAIGRTIVKKSV